MKHILFICSQNRRRSPTAEKVFSGRPGIEVASAGLNPDAAKPMTADLLAWAEAVFVMEEVHRIRLTRGYGELLSSKNVHCLDIPDEFEYMEKALVRLLEIKMAPFLARMAG